MALSDYFTKLLARVEASDIQNDGKDENGFYKPTRELLIRHVTLLRDLHQKPLARAMTRASWAFVVAHAPPEWLVLGTDDKRALREMLGD